MSQKEQLEPRAGLPWERRHAGSEGQALAGTLEEPRRCVGLDPEPGPGIRRLCPAGSEQGALETNG